MKCCRCDHCLNPKEVGQQTELRICENCGEVFCDQCPDVGQNMETCPECGGQPTHPIANNGKSIVAEILDILRGK